ncbi:hypothetical protein DICVIV_10682 [Dictyocaulus viviparus]|uniref:Patched family protein n=1 Tax=Dictyocaulus viviparus TaxID=29172 RepID=A0A0D8XHU2_DICVI|nr:hypothetical protein DICVIV_10682 [Dictyocaulus viviparus]
MIIDSTVWSSIAAAFFCTAIACFLFIPNVACMVTACSSVLSITIGILGLLSLWGLDLDPLSMAALLMAVGFSVDFTSHIAYHFYKSKHEESALRIEETLTCIGWPLVQVGLSTIIAISPIFLKPSYTIVVFFKTIVIVCLLGMFHGLVLMPAILSAIFELSKDSFGESLNKLKESSLLCSHQHSIDQTENDTDRKRIWSSFWTKKVAPEPINRQPAFNNQIITRT